MSDSLPPASLSNAGDADLQPAVPDEARPSIQPTIATTPTAEPVPIEGDERLRPFIGGTLTRILFGAEHR